MLIVDAHEDIAWNALSFGRDHTQSALAVRAREQGTPAPQHNGSTMLGLTEWLLGRVAVVFATLFAAPARRKLGEWDTQCYTDFAEAGRLYSAQLDYYHRLADTGRFRLIQSVKDLEAVLESWQGELKDRKIGLAVLMENAEAIRDPAELEMWVERGLRLIGPAWAGTRFCGGTAEPGPLTAEGHALLEAMADHGLILDLSHMAEESFLEAADLYPGVVIASHSNARALVRGSARPDRHLSDEMIRRLAERDGVIGVVPYNRFLSGDWTAAEGKSAVRLDAVVAQIDHICQLTGSAAHAGIGSDFDGGFGAEAVPAEIDTVADLMKIGEALRERGYAEKDVEAIMGGNWLAVLRRGLPD